jgi:hypothetical protein
MITLGGQNVSHLLISYLSGQSFFWRVPKPPREEVVMIFRKMLPFRIVMILGIVILGAGLSITNNSQAVEVEGGMSGACYDTAEFAYSACRNEVKDDYWIALGNCRNISGGQNRADCREDVEEEFKEAKALCTDQRKARLKLCKGLGKGRYDPRLDPIDFVDPSTITVATANPYFPLVPGTKWVYEARDAGDNLLERITVIVKSEIKTIEYPEESGNFFICAVVNDVVEEFMGGDPKDDGNYVVIEDTDDWYIQNEATKDVWYMGEISQELEEDLDGNKELVEIEGSWKAGRDFDKPGILMYGDPDPANEDQQNPYRQEFSLGNAEDAGKVKSKGTASVSVPYGDFDVDVVKTKDWTPIEPDVKEFKYYAPGVGMIKEENPEDGESVVLIDKTTVP